MGEVPPPHAIWKGGGTLAGGETVLHKGGNILVLKIL